MGAGLAVTRLKNSHPNPMSVIHVHETVMGTSSHALVSLTEQEAESDVPEKNRKRQTR